MNEMLQKNENIAKNVANENSQDLTEQWKKEELPEAWYYVKDIHNKEILDRYFKEIDNFECLENWEVDEVLAPVPSYEEWQAKLAQNAQLKELLKEVKDYLPEFEMPMNIFAKIDEALQ